MRHRIRVTTILMSELRSSEQVKIPERDHVRTTGLEESRRDKQQAT